MAVRLEDAADQTRHRPHASDRMAPYGRDQRGKDQKTPPHKNMPHFRDIGRLCSPPTTFASANVTEENRMSTKPDPHLLAKLCGVAIVVLITALFADLRFTYGRWFVPALIVLVILAVVNLRTGRQLYER